MDRVNDLLAETLQTSEAEWAELDGRRAVGTPEWRRARARKAALVMHSQGKTNTKAASKAAMARFPDAEARRAYMHDLAERSAATRQLNAVQRDLRKRAEQSRIIHSDVSVPSPTD